MEVIGKLLGSYREISGKLLGRYREVTGKFLGRYQEVIEILGGYRFLLLQAEYYNYSRKIKLPQPSSNDFFLLSQTSP